MSYLSRDITATSAEFQARVRGCLSHVCYEIFRSTDQGDTASRRESAARAVVTDLGRWVPIFAHHVAANENTGNGDSSDPAHPELGDGALQWVVNDRFNKLTGVDTK